MSLATAPAETLVPKRRSRATARHVWKNLSDDLFALLDQASSDLRRLECNPVDEMQERFPSVATIALQRVIDAWRQDPV